MSKRKWFSSVSRAQRGGISLLLVAGLTFMSLTLLAAAGLLAYCWSVFGNLEQMMNETPAYQPTSIFSRPVVLRTGAPLGGPQALEELRSRLGERRYHVVEQEVAPGTPFTLPSGESSSTTTPALSFTWRMPRFDYPEGLRLYLEKQGVHVPLVDTEVVALIGVPGPNAPSLPAVQLHPSSPQGPSCSTCPLLLSLRVTSSHTESPAALALPPTLAAYISGSNKSIREYLHLDEIPTLLKEAIISVEDQRFREHLGFDLRSLTRALWINLRHGHMSQGGSTITQQLVKNLRHNPKKTIWRKLNELILAILIEFKFDKETILEKYMNEVYFGQIGSLEVHGVSEAARYFFNKKLNQLTVAESALMAGVIRGPALYSPYRNPKRALQRKDVVLHKLLEQGYIANEEYEAALKEPIHFSAASVGRNEAPYFADFIKAKILEWMNHGEAGSPSVAPGGASGTTTTNQNQDLDPLQGLRVFTTLDTVIQKHMDRALAEQVPLVERALRERKESKSKANWPDDLHLAGSMAAARLDTGEIVALSGGHSYEHSTFNRILNMKRPVGSTFKPIVYAAALHSKKWRASSLILDAPFTHKYERGQAWSPQNYDKKYLGPVTLRKAFKESLNVPMAKVGLDTGLNEVVSWAERLGVQTKLPAVPSLVLGTVEMGILELLQVYLTLGNLGEKPEMTALLSITDKDGRELMTPSLKRTSTFEPALGLLLRSLLGSVTQSGTAQALRTQWGYRLPAYGKTGTTSFYRDSWFAGFSEDIAAVAWVGVDELKSEQNFPGKLTGATGALPVWAKFFTEVYGRGEGIEPPLPEGTGLNRVWIDPNRDCSLKSPPPAESSQALEELYLPGTEPSPCSDP